MFKLLSIFISLAFAAAAFAASVNGPTFGSFTVQCPADSDTYIGILPTRMPAFTGEVDGMTLSSRKISARGEPNWKANKFVYQSGVQTNHYYLKFTSGELEGAWFDISANDSYSVQISIGEAEFRKISVGDAFQIIPHWTMATLFPDGGGFAKATSLFPTRNRSVLWKSTTYENSVEYPVGINPPFLSSFYYRKYGKVDGWLDKGDSDASDSVIEPNACFVVTQPKGVASEVVYSGVIPMCATSFELFTTESDSGGGRAQHILIPVPSAVEIKLSDLTEGLVGSGAFLASQSIRRTDVLYLYDNSSLGHNITPAETFSYRKTSSKSYWENASYSVCDDYLLKAGTVLKFLKATSKLPSTFRCKITPSYLNK